MFKIFAPYIILPAFFAMLNARLQLPPFSLFLVALMLTDGESEGLLHVTVPNHQTVMTITFFLNVTDTGEQFSGPCV